MTIFGTIMAMLFAVFASLFLGPYAVLVLLSVTFGFVLSTHMRNKEIQADLKRIKEKLGIDDEADFHMRDEEIEDELDKDGLSDNENKELAALNEQIEKELEAYAEEEDEDRHKKK